MRAKSELTTARLVEGAASVIRREGLHACTHRAVAAEAGVSLGTTTYYFKTLDCLLAAVMQQAIADFCHDARQWLSQQNARPAADTLTDFLFRTLDERQRLTTEYELFVAAISRPLLRPHAADWLAAHEELLVSYLSLNSSQARAAAALTDAWLMRGLLTEGSPLAERGAIHALFSAIVAMER